MQRKCWKGCLQNNVSLRATKPLMQRLWMGKNHVIASQHVTKPWINWISHHFSWYLHWSSRFWCLLQGLKLKQFESSHAVRCWREAPENHRHFPLEWSTWNILKAKSTSIFLMSKFCFQSPAKMVQKFRSVPFVPWSQLRGMEPLLSTVSESWSLATGLMSWPYKGWLESLSKVDVWW